VKTFHPVNKYRTQNCEAELVYIDNVLHIKVTTRVKELMARNGGLVPTSISCVIPLGVQVSMIDVDLDEEPEDENNTLPFPKGEPTHA